MLDRMIVGEHIERIEVLKVILGSILHQEITRHRRDVESLFPKERRRPRQVAGRGNQQNGCWAEQALGLRDSSSISIASLGTPSRSAHRFISGASFKASLNGFPLPPAKTSFGAKPC